MKLILIFCCCLISIGCSSQQVLQQENEYIQSTIIGHPSISHHYLMVNGNTLHYAAHGQSTKPVLIIIHGTPGNWQQYARYMLNQELLEQYYVVLIDRPGWGESTLAKGKKIASFKEQAVIIAALIKQLRQHNKHQPVVIMGHSLGASLAPRIAMDFPSLVDGLLLFAGTIDPALASPRWFNYLATFPFSQYVIGDELHRANKEIFALQDNIDAMANRWHEIKASVIAVQGMKDTLVSPKNSRYIKASFNANTTQVISLPLAGHLFPMTKRQEVVAWAKQLLLSINRH